MRRFETWVALGLVGAALAACGGNDDAGTERAAGAANTPAASAPSDGGAPATMTERDALAFVREEEKLARDVYQALAAHDRLFSNIQRSEQMHMDAVLTLLDRYGIPDPAAGAAVGAFTNPTLQQLHDALVAQGGTSRIAALTVGVEIEELDIHDIESLRSTTTRNDVLTTFDNLTRGSRNHLRAFYGQLQALGGTYTPRHLDADTFRAIIESPNESGGPGP